MTPEEYKDFLAKRKPEKVAKYRNVKKVANGVEFDSTKEANRYVDLCLWQKTGQIHGLEHQKPFSLVVNGVEVATYVADYVYFKDGEMIVEDVKSKITRKNATYRLKFKLIEAIYGIAIQEI